MTKKQLKKWLPEINHWINGGDLYAYDPIDDTWTLKIDDTFRTDQIYVIKDEHFETRKAYALGENIECRRMTDATQNVWKPCIPEWRAYIEYRQKPKELIYDYQFIFRRDGRWHMSIGRWQGIKEAMHFIVGSDIAKFEPSKKEKE